MVLLMCMFKLPLQLVFYTLLHPQLRHLLALLVQCHHGALFFVFYYSLSVSLSGLFTCLFLAVYIMFI